MSKPLTIAILTSDEREPRRNYSDARISFGFAPDALLEGLAQFPDHQIHLIACLQRPVTSPSHLAGNIRYHPLLVGKWGWLRIGYLGCLLAIRRKLTELSPDVVHGQGTERHCALCAAFSGFPNLITIHGNMRRLAALQKAIPFSFMWLQARMESLVLQKTMGVICNSLHTESLVKGSARRTWLVPNALSSCFFSPVKREPSSLPLLLNIGTISPLKRQLELLNLLESLHRQRGDFETKFFGRPDTTSDYSTRFLKAINQQSAQSFAQYSGFVESAELVRQLDSASAVIHVSAEESFGLVIAEALSRNLKVFAFRAGGVGEIANGVDGAELFDQNDWAGLCQRLSNWLAAGAPLPTRAAAQMRIRYSPGAVAEQHLQIYHGLSTQTAKPERFPAPRSSTD